MLCWIVCPFLGIILFFGSDLLGIFFCTNNCCAFLKEFARKITTNYMEVLTSSNKPMSIVIYVLRYASSYIRTSGLENGEIEQKKKNHFYSTTIGPFGVAHIKTFKHTNWFWSFLANRYSCTTYFPKLYFFGFKHTVLHSLDYKNPQQKCLAAIFKV